MSSGRSFSVELDSKTQVKNVILAEGTGERVLFEGSIGRLCNLGVIEEAILEIKGSKGTIRVDLTKQEVQSLLRSGGENK